MLKHDDTCGLCNGFGDIAAGRPLPLFSAVRRDLVMGVDLTNPDIYAAAT